MEAKKLNLIQKLSTIQKLLKAPKNQYNKFGKYKYRSCEDIVEAAKPLLFEAECSLKISDEIVLIGERYYVKATVRITDSNGEYEEASAFAREEDSKSGMAAAQLTGSTSSYARKYALNGLFGIDDTKDADSTNKHEKANMGQKSAVGVDQMILQANQAAVKTQNPPSQAQIGKLRSLFKNMNAAEVKCISEGFIDGYTASLLIEKYA